MENTHVDIGIINDYRELRRPVLNNIVVPNYIAEVDDIIKSRHKWRKAASIIEALGQLLLGAASVLAFSAGFFNNTYLTFSAACCSTLCLALGRLSTYAENECVERNTILKRLFKRIELESMPSISSIEDAASNRSSTATPDAMSSTL